MISTGANLYHDVHHGLGMPIHEGRPTFDDVALRDDGVIRIYDIVFPYEVLLDTDAFFREMLKAPDFQRPMSTAEFHWLAGRFLAARQKTLGVPPDQSVLASAYRYDVPIYTSSPGRLLDRHERRAPRARGGRLLVRRLGRRERDGVDRLRREARGREERRPHHWAAGARRTSSCRPSRRSRRSSGSTRPGTTSSSSSPTRAPTRAASRARRRPRRSRGGRSTRTRLPDTVVCYCDATIALPLLTAYALGRHAPRPLKRLYRAARGDDGDAAHRVRGGPPGRGDQQAGADGLPRDGSATSVSREEGARGVPDALRLRREIEGETGTKPAGRGAEPPERSPGRRGRRASAP